jgi:hypothetical protein
MDPRGTRIPLRTRRLSARAFWRRYGRLEHERLEFKRSAQRVHESVVAMAMAGGGTIVLGVADDRRLVGCPPDQGTLDRIALVAHGRILRRLGSANQPLRGDAVARFVRARDAGAAQ